MLSTTTLRELTKRWSKASLECYQRQCKCEGCIYKEKLETNKNCNMKHIVLEMVRVLGKPTTATIQQIKDEEDGN